MLSQANLFFGVWRRGKSKDVCFFISKEYFVSFIFLIPKSQPISHQALLNLAPFKSISKTFLWCKLINPNPKIISRKLLQHFVSGCLPLSAFSPLLWDSNTLPLKGSGCISFQPNLHFTSFFVVVIYGQLLIIHKNMFFSCQFSRTKRWAIVL